MIVCLEFLWLTVENVISKHETLHLCFEVGHLVQGSAEVLFPDLENFFNAVP